MQAETVTLMPRAISSRFYVPAPAYGPYAPYGGAYYGGVGLYRGVYYGGGASDSRRRRGRQKPLARSLRAPSAHLRSDD
jgi:hypothetical protein